MRRFDSIKLVTVCLIVGGIHADAKAAPAFTVEVIDSPATASINFARANHNGQVVFATWARQYFVWTTGGSVREVIPPAGYHGSPHIGPAGEVYLTQQNDYARSVRIHPDGRVDHLRLAHSDLYPFDGVVPGNISSVTPGGRVVGLHRAHLYFTHLMVTWEADGVTPTVVTITTPNQFDRYNEYQSSDTGRGVGQLYPNQGNHSVPAMRDQGVLRPLPMAGRDTGSARGISSDGRFAVGSAWTSTDDFTSSLPDQAAILWTEDGDTVLPVPEWAVQSGAGVVNSLGQIVGGVWSEERSAVAYWDSQRNVYELESLMITDRTIDLEYVSTIDDQGRILVAGWEMVDGSYYDKLFFLTPIPEPALIGLVVMLGVGLRRVR